MTNEQVYEIVRGVPHMALERAKLITSFIIEHKLLNILELGFRHGVSTCYMANALAELGGGHITTIDLENARQAKPNIEDLLERVGQRQRVTVYYESRSYTWRMMKMLEADPAPRFDFCFVDGAHNWFVDGFAFFLADRLLKAGGWMLFDDLNWTYDDSPCLRNSDLVREMPEEERTTPQVLKVYELLVKPHPSYDNFRVNQGWAYAQKRANAVAESTVIKREVITQEVGLGVVANKLYRRLRR